MILPLLLVCYVLTRPSVAKPHFDCLASQTQIAKCWPLLEHIIAPQAVC